MKLLTVLLVNSNLDFGIDDDNVEILRTDYVNIKNAIENANGKYVIFICNEDYISDDFFNYICTKMTEEFDCCYINHEIKFDLPREVKHTNTYEHLITLKPYYLEYIWSYMFKTDILREILKLEFDYNFDSRIDELVKEMTAIPEIIYFHVPNSDGNHLYEVPYIDYKSVEYYKNIIYLKNNLGGIFNGLITWVYNIGRCFGDKYDLTLMYDYCFPETEKRLSKYFKVIHREKFVNYFCDRYISSYVDYDTPENIFYNEECSTFIHGLLLENSYLTNDIYDNYIAVSNTCLETVRFDFTPKKEPYFIHNPVCIRKSEVKPHLHLVSTLRSEECKGLARLEKVSNILDEEKIPYTWNVFTDVNEGTNHNGFIYRNSVADVLSYVKDADYLVLLTDIESFCYSVIEALMLDTKVVVTPVKVFEEIGVVDKENALVIPFEYFEDNNKDKLREKVLQMYNEKDKKIKFKPTKLNYKRYSELFKK